MTYLPLLIAALLAIFIVFGSVAIALVLDQRLQQRRRRRDP